MNLLSFTKLDFRLCGVLVSFYLLGHTTRIEASPVITQHPEHQSASPSSNATFSVTAAGVAPLDYQWLLEGVTLSEGGRFSGTTSSNLTITNLTGSDAGWYRVIVSDSSGSVTSELASLTVNLATIDPSVAPTPTGFVDSLAIQPDEKILVGGAFSSFSGQSRTRLARLNADGTFDASFNAGITGSITAGICMQADGKIVVTGNMTIIFESQRASMLK